MRKLDYTDPIEHIYITAARSNTFKPAGADSALPDIHALMPWVQDRLIRQAKDAQDHRLAMHRAARRVGVTRKVLKVAA